MIVLRVSQPVIESGVRVPPFDVAIGEFVRLEVPSPFGPNWAEVMSLLAGKRTNRNINRTEKLAYIEHLCLRHDSTSAASASVVDYAETLRISKDRAREILSHLRINEDTRIGELQSTPRLLLDLYFALEQPVELVIYSSCGLDPGGSKKVSTFVSSKLNAIGAIDVVSPPYRRVPELLTSFSKIVACELVADQDTT